MPASRRDSGLIVPASFQATQSLNRRSFLRTAGIGAGLLASPGLLAACARGDDGGGASGSKTVSVGMNEAVGSGRAYDQAKARMDAFTKGGDFTAKVKYVDHNTFQEQINNYLQGQPDDVFSWFAGYRVQTFADKGLVGDVSDAFPSAVSDAVKKASTDSEGKQVFIPTNNYPWAVFYFKSLWEKNGYEVPKTLDELVALCKKMKDDGLDPIAFADKDGWPAMGTFDILNMRINGYDYHLNLMAGEESWDDAKVKTVFDTWRGLLPYHQPDPLGRAYQESVSSLQQKKSGMYYFGLFLTDSLPIEQQNDIGFFTFPEIDSAIGADAIDAPIDGFCMSANPKNEEGALALLEFLGSEKGNDALTAKKIPQIATNEDADTSGYTDLQKQAAEFMGQAASIAQFLDRDTDPAFASTVMTPALQTFLKSPDDVDGLVKSIEKQRQSIFG